MTEQVEQQRQFLGAPSTCGSEFDDIAWTGTVAVHLHDDLHLGVRFNDAGVQAHVAAALGDRVRDHAGASRGLLRTPRQGRTPQGGPAAPALLRRPTGPRHARPRAAARRRRPAPQPAPRAARRAARQRRRRCMTPRGVLLVPGRRPGHDRVGRPAAGPRGVHVRATCRGRAPRRRRHRRGARAGRRRHGDRRRARRASAPRWPRSGSPAGRYPIAGWLLSVPADQTGPLRPAAAVAHAARLLETPFPSGAQAALDGIVALAARVPMTGVSWATPDELVGQVRDAGRG